MHPWVPLHCDELFTQTAEDSFFFSDERFSFKQRLHNRNLNLAPPPTPQNVPTIFTLVCWWSNSNRRRQSHAFDRFCAAANSRQAKNVSLKSFPGTFHQSCTINICPIIFPTPSKAKHMHTSQSPSKKEGGKTASSLKAIEVQQYKQQKQRHTQRFVALKPSFEPSNKWPRLFALALYTTMSGEHLAVQSRTEQQGSPSGGYQGR